MADTYADRKNASPQSRLGATIHAAVTLLTWEYPETAADDWLPSPEQVTDKTRAMYRITPTDDDINAALAEADKRRITA